VSVDETTLASRREVVNVVIGVLKTINTIREIIYAVMHGNVCCESHNNITCFNEAMQTQWLDGVKFDNVLLLVTDGAPYKKKNREMDLQ
jgi:hypothetical protein